MNVDLREFIVAYLAEHGPSTAPEMGGVSFTSASIRQTASRMAEDGDIVRAGTRSATNALGDVVGGPRAIVWALPIDEAGT